jgi:hypothetical protein
VNKPSQRPIWLIAACVTAAALLVIMILNRHSDLPSPAKNVSGGDSSVFFRTERFSPDKEIHEASVRRYSQSLEDLEESPLAQNEQSPSLCYRLLVLPPNAKPIIVRITVSGSQHILVAKISRERHGVEKGRIERTVELPLTAHEQDTFARLASELDFFSLPTTEGTSGFDGTFWILEGSNGRNYHLVVRWQPDAGPFHNFCKFLMESAGFKRDDALLWGTLFPGS